MTKKFISKQVMIILIFGLFFIKPSNAEDFKDLFGLKIYENTSAKSRHNANHESRDFVILEITTFCVL